MAMTDMPFPNTPRVDARDKVRGKALFAADDARVLLECGDGDFFDKHCSLLFELVLQSR